MALAGPSLRRSPFTPTRARLCGMLRIFAEITSQNQPTFRAIST